jgi:5-methyltetrahydropteroyltriglutamate--homocysteine methyltransferase
LTLDLDAPTREAFRWALRRLSSVPTRPRLMLCTYFGALQENVEIACEAGCEGLHIDLVRASAQLQPVLGALNRGMVLSAGVVDGRNVWCTDLERAHALVRTAVRALGSARVMVAPSCSLLHVPVDLRAERRLDPELRSWLAFASQKLEEVRALADAAETDVGRGAAFAASRAAADARRASTRTHDAAVRARVRDVLPALLNRGAPFSARSRKQNERFGLPAFPTTTIGSFPQTAEVRGARAAWRTGALTEQAYQTFLRAETRACIAKQEALGLDVLVHGELERNDMVEYFGEQLQGFAFTENGWVQSYGSRCVKPPLLFGDVARPRAMTRDWATFASSLTKRPVKGMLTGPVTILQWSFVRDDQPRADTCRQLALALRDEVSDLDAAGIGMIQVDEPALREGLPLRKAERAAYLRWAVDAFRLATSGVRDDTQIHTHMCYAEFGDILPAIAEMDADVISIETSRSGMALLADFGRFAYPNQVGPGVYDIHAPRVPSVDEMEELLRRAVKVLPADRLWVNPDCGLKTRGWSETEAALRNLVQAAARLRAAG